MHDVSQSVRRITLFDRDFSLLPIWIAGSDCQNRGHRNQRNGRPSSKRGGTERSSFTLVSWTERGDQQCLPSYMTSSNHVCLLHSKKHLLYIYITTERYYLRAHAHPPPQKKNVTGVGQYAHEFGGPLGRMLLLEANTLKTSGS